MQAVLIITDGKRVLCTSKSPIQKAMNKFSTLNIDTCYINFHLPQLLHPLIGVQTIKFDFSHMHIHS